MALDEAVDIDDGLCKSGILTYLPTPPILFSFLAEGAHPAGCNGSQMSSPP